MKIGTKVVMKSDGCKGIIDDSWIPHVVNSKVFDNNAPIGFAVSLKNGSTRICTEDDFEIEK